LVAKGSRRGVKKKLSLTDFGHWRERRDYAYLLKRVRSAPTSPSSAQMLSWAMYYVVSPLSEESERRGGGRAQNVSL